MDDRFAAARIMGLMFAFALAGTVFGLLAFDSAKAGVSIGLLGMLVGVIIGVALERVAMFAPDEPKNRIDSYSKTDILIAGEAVDLMNDYLSAIRSIAWQKAHAVAITRRCLRARVDQLDVKAAMLAIVKGSELEPIFEKEFNYVGMDKGDDPLA